MSGYVYLIVSSSGFYKVGFTKNDPRRRVSMLRTGTSDELELVGAVRGTIEDERELHRLLSPWRVTREWFSPCPAIEYLSEVVTPIHAGKVVRHPLAVARRKCGMTQAMLADALGVDRVTVARIETGVSTSLKTIAKALAVIRARGVELSINDFLPVASTPMQRAA
jgi:DNA-binding XRE family transcriptional regulator